MKKNNPNPKIPYHTRNSETITIIIARITNGMLQLWMQPRYLPTPDLHILSQQLYASPKQFYLRKWGNADS